MRQTHLVHHFDLALPPPLLFLVWPRPLPAPNRKWEEHLVAKQRQRAPFSASYLAVPHSSLSPSSLLFGYPTIRLPPSLAFCFLSPREVSVNRATETEGGGENGSDRLKRKQTGNGSTIHPSINLTSFSKTLLFLSAWSPIGFAATRSLY